jgi:NADPH:quinone reductase-like Zn-dependent oxidoreductase
MMPPLPAIPGVDCCDDNFRRDRHGQSRSCSGQLPDRLSYDAHHGPGQGRTNDLGLCSIYDLDPQLTAESFALLFDYLAKGQIKPHIHERLPLSEAARAHELLESGAVKGKLILKP